MNDSAGSQPTGGTKKDTVTVRSGAWKKEVPAGTTVAEARKILSNTTSIDANATAYSGTQAVSDDTVLESGMSLEFIKKTGEKG